MSTRIAIPSRYRVREVVRDDDVEFLARADDATLHREVVLKAPGPALRRHLVATGDLDRLLREARALAAVRHAGVVRLLEIVECAGGPLLVLEPYPGETLAERVARSGPLTGGEVRALGVALASALTELHAAGAVHRAVSPETVVLGTDGAPILTGFGFAKSTAGAVMASSIEYRDAPAESATREAPPGLPLPRYVAPEQRAGQPANARSDVFALGATLAFAATGRDPTLGADGRAVSGLDSSGIGRIIDRCLARSPLQRFQSAAELERALAEFAAPTATEPGAAARRVPRRRIAVGVVVIAGLAAVVFAVVPGLLDHRETNDDRGRAVAPASTASTGEVYASTYHASHALLIGIGDAYAARGYGALKNAEADVAALKDRLERMPWEGWRITALVGAAATKAAILDALAALVDTAPDDRVLVYFAGHGERDPNDLKSGFLIPADGAPRKSAADENGWISSDELNGKIRRMRAKHVLLMLDCCFGGVMTRFRSGDEQRYGTLLLTEKAHLVIASGRPNQRVPDGDGAHSPFLAAFLDALSSDGEAITASALFAKIQAGSPAGGGALPTFAPLEDGGSGDVVFFLTRPR